jgi:hypothetical protein
MGIGGSILLIVVGAILTFGLDDTDLGPFNLDTIGWILQAAGLVGLVLTLWIWNSRRTRVVEAPPRTTTRTTDSVVDAPPRATDSDEVTHGRYTERRNY